MGEERGAPPAGAPGASEGPDPSHTTVVPQRDREGDPADVRRRPPALPTRGVGGEAEPLPGLPDTYRWAGLIGRGGSGEVHRVEDTRLGRALALKVLQRRWSTGADQLARFRAEARVTAQLEHPGIVPVYDIGRLADGRLYYTMKEVRGRELGEIIAAVHEGREGERWRPTLGGWTFRRLVEVFRQLCQAVGYAHARGVVHRDLKPANVMVGAFGEVVVMDWGLALATIPAPADGAPPALDPPSSAPARRVVGTPGYMAPEQARGDLDDLGPSTDVHALGAVLHLILSGRLPYEGATGEELCRQVIAGPPEPLTAASAPGTPEALRALAAWALEGEVRRRPADARVLAREVEAWLDGDRRQARGLAVLAGVEPHLPRMAHLLMASDQLRSQADALKATLPPWAPAEALADAWALEDQADAIRREVDLLEVAYVQGLRGALTHDPDLPEAHRQLAAHYRRRHAAAEEAGDAAQAARYEILLKEHDRGGAHRAYLDGAGAFTVVTDPPGAAVTLHRWEERGRRLALGEGAPLGPSPVLGAPLAPGRYLAILGLEGREEVRCPLLVERGGAWTGIRPGAVDPHPIPLPPAGSLGPGEVYIPPGWFWMGGDRRTSFSLPRRRVWVDGLVIQRFPITNAEYIAFLDALVAEGRADAALLHQPRERYLDGELGQPIYGRREGGTFYLRPDAEGDMWDPQEPVTNIEWLGAATFARWRAQRDGLPWRLPGELEWEKAARGADGRRYPWGDHLHPAWCSMAFSREGRPMPAVVDSFPVDESPYGVRGMGGNVRDWCLERFARAGPPMERPDLYRPPLGELEVAREEEARRLAGEAVRRTERSLRGGAWIETREHMASSERFGDNSGRRTGHVGFRLARSWPEVG